MWLEAACKHCHSFSLKNSLALLLQLNIKEPLDQKLPRACANLEMGDIKSHRFPKRFLFIAALSLRIHLMTIHMMTSLRIQPSSIASAWGNLGFSLSRYGPLLFKRAKLLSFCCLILNYPNLRDLSGSLTTNRTARWGVWVWSWRDFHVHQGRSCFRGGIFLFQLLLNKPAIKERILFYLRKSRRRTLPQFEYLLQDW